MFSGPILTMAKTWKQPKCPSADEWIRKEWIRKEGRYIYIYIYTHTYTYIHTYTCIHIYKRILFSHRKNEILSFATTWVDLENIILKVKTNREWFFFYVESKKQSKWTNKIKPKETQREIKLMIDKAVRSWAKHVKRLKYKLAVTK